MSIPNRVGQIWMHKTFDNNSNEYVDFFMFMVKETKPIEFRHKVLVLDNLNFNFADDGNVSVYENDCEMWENLSYFRRIL
jgi:hypothetical protein